MNLKTALMSHLTNPEMHLPISFIHIKTDFRTPKQPQVEAIAGALDISPLALKDFGVENARDLLGLLLQLEDEFGIVPAEDGSGLSIDASAEKAPKTTQMLKAWAAKCV